MKFLIEEIYDNKGNLLNPIYSSKKEESYDNKGNLLNPVYSEGHYNSKVINGLYIPHKHKIKYAVFIDSLGKELVSFDYKEITYNLMIDNPTCFLFDKNQKIVQYFDILEQELYHYEEDK